MNATAPDFARLPEADLADMASFLEQLTIVLSIIGFDILRTRQRAPSRRRGRSRAKAKPKSPSREEHGPAAAYAGRCHGSHVCRAQGSVQSGQ
jgi:hypothetical protein